jgi:hypothetical protein
VEVPRLTLLQEEWDLTPTAAGLSLALVRRLRGLLMAAVGVLALTLSGDH